MNVFIDAGPLRALVTPQDQWRNKTLEITKAVSRQNAQFITSDYVIDEVFTGLLGDLNAGYHRIKEFDKLITRSNGIKIEWITQERFYQAKLLFLKTTKDKQWSFTDCTSFIIIKELKIQKVFTFDEHFKQMGFTILK